MRSLLGKQFLCEITAVGLNSLPVTHIVAQKFYSFQKCDTDRLPACEKARISTRDGQLQNMTRSVILYSTTAFVLNMGTTGNHEELMAIIENHWEPLRATKNH